MLGMAGGYKGPRVESDLRALIRMNNSGPD